MSRYYKVEKIIAKKEIEGEPKYLIKWVGWPIESATWEPIENLSLIHKMVKDFERSLQKKKEEDSESIESSEKKAKRYIFNNLEMSFNKTYPKRDFRDSLLKFPRGHRVRHPKEYNLRKNG